MPARRVHRRTDEATLVTFAPEIVRVPTGIVNVYLVGHAAAWVLVDTGIRGFSARIRRAAESQFGNNARPLAIILTHGHFDHAGNVDALAARWHVPVYAHTLELPYLTGQSDYPPQDPTVGGAMAFMSRAFPHGGRDIGRHLTRLAGNRIVEMPGWTWHHTPGHTAGHVALFRESDRVLLAGDAMATMDLNSWREQIRQRPRPSNPPAATTTDWDAARRSVVLLASLQPTVVAAGHGLPLVGAEVADALRTFCQTFRPPVRGRYVTAPAATGPAGVEWLPAPVRDPFARHAAGIALLALGAVGLAAAAHRRR